MLLDYMPSFVIKCTESKPGNGEYNKRPAKRKPGSQMMEVQVLAGGV